MPGARSMSRFMPALFIRTSRPEGCWAVIKERRESTELGSDMSRVCHCGCQWSREREREARGNSKGEVL